MTKRTDPRELDPGTVADGDYVLTVAGGVITGLSAASPGGSTGVVETIVPGPGIAVDDADPANPVVSATGGSGGGSGVEAWIQVGAAGAPAFQNSWHAYDTGGTFEMPAFRKDGDGMVWLRGLAAGGISGTVTFTLPAGYRPSRRVFFPSFGGDGNLARVDVYPDGTVKPTANNTGFVLLSTAIFAAAP